MILRAAAERHGRVSTYRFSRTFGRNRHTTSPAATTYLTAAGRIHASRGSDRQAFAPKVHRHAFWMRTYCAATRSNPTAILTAAKNTGSILLTAKRDRSVPAVHIWLYVPLVDRGLLLSNQKFPAATLILSDSSRSTSASQEPSTNWDDPAEKACDVPFFGECSSAFTPSQTRLLDALLRGDTLKSHRYLDGGKEYRLHPLNGEAAASRRRTPACGQGAAAQEFPAATLILSPGPPCGCNASLSRVPADPSQ